MQALLVLAYLRKGETFIDDCGTADVAWDDEDGHMLGLIPGTEYFELLLRPSSAR